MTILNALEDFLERVRDDETVIIYLGGHGDTRPGAEDFGAAFLPFDFEDEGFRRAIPIASLFEIIGSRLAPKSGSKVVLLINACESGALPQANPSETAEAKAELERLKRRFPKGGLLAYIPAVPGAQNTYELPDKGSEYALSLVAGLDGPAAEGGVVTSGSLLRYLQANLARKPKPPARLFDDGITIGFTQSREAAYRGWIGRALVSAALRRGPDRELLKLALFHLERAGPPNERSLEVLVAELRARTLLDDLNDDTRQRVEASVASRGVTRP